MARPDTSFPAERRGSTCGASWPDPLRVTGRLSPTNAFGEDIFVDRARIADPADLRRGDGQLSWGGAHEQRVRRAFEDRIKETLNDLVTFADALGEENRDAVEGLLRMAVDNLDYVDAIHEKWTSARWPLSRGHYNDEHCTRELDMGKVFGGGFDRCPTYDTHLERNEDRDEILKRFVDSAHAIRCAEWGMWRVVLYRRALAEWKKTPQGGGPRGLAPTPPKKPKSPAAGGGAFAAQPPGPPPPPTPPAPPSPVLPDFPPELGEALPPPPPPEPEPELGEPAGLGETPPAPPTEPPIDPPLPQDELPFDDRGRSIEGDDPQSVDWDDGGLDSVERAAAIGFGTLVLGGIATTAIIGATIYGVSKVIKGKPEDKERKRR